MHSVMVLFGFDYNSFIYLHFKLTSDLNNLLIRIYDYFKSHSSVEFEINHSLDLKFGHLTTIHWDKNLKRLTHTNMIY